MSLDTGQAAQLVGAMVLGSGGVIAWVARIAENKGRRHAEKRLEKADSTAELHSLVDQLQEQCKDLRAELAEKRAEAADAKAEAEKQRQRADHYEDRYDKFTSEYRAKQLRELEERERQG